MCVPGESNDTSAYLGLLQPLPILSKVWESIAMDLIKGLPKINGKDVIWAILEQLSKYSHFIPLAHPFSASTLAQPFMDNVYRIHGPQVEIISDRYTLFISNF